jgi:hypothetical protein
MRTSLLLLPALALAGCAVDAGGEPSSTTDESAVVSGPLDWSQPAVGALGSCSATLVAPDVVLTSSGCRGEAFEVRDARGSVAGTYATREERAAGELVVVKLASAVPADVATPIALADVVPADGARVTVLGFGCTGQRIEDTRKRSASIRFTRTLRASCPGTLVFDEAGRAAAVGSALVPPVAAAIRGAL